LTGFRTGLRLSLESQKYNPVFLKDKTILSRWREKPFRVDYTTVFIFGGFKDLTEAGIETETA
jgi:hypothetical protein